MWFFLSAPKQFRPVGTVSSEDSCAFDTFHAIKIFKGSIWESEQERDGRQGGNERDLNIYLYGFRMMSKSIVCNVNGTVALFRLNFLKNESGKKRLKMRNFDTKWLDKCEEQKNGCAKEPNQKSYIL